KPTLYKTSPLKEMNIYLANSTQKSLDSFPLPMSLSKMTIKASFLHRAQCDLGSILLKCPSLEEFCAEGHGMRVSSTVVMSFWWPKRRQELHPHPFSLRSLVLSNIAFAQPELENLLRLTPNLKELKLVAMMLFYNKMSFDWIRLFRSLTENNITLDKAHFSNFESRMSEEETELLLSNVYPKSSQERSFWAFDVTPQLLQTVFLQPDTLTTLEVLWKVASLSPFTEERKRPALVAAARLVHQYLCVSPHLVHLTTLKTEIHLEDLDLFHRAGYTDLDRRQSATPEEIASDNSPLPPAVWGCQGLRSLHIVLHAPFPFHPVHSRILFGYISRVSPALVDLQISIPQGCHDPFSNGHKSPEYYLQLKGGLCLLNRMKYLQRLKVVSDPEYTIKTCEDWDLNWMLRSGFLCRDARNKRHKEIMSWSEWRRNEDQIERTRARVWQPARSYIDDTNHHNSLTTDMPILDQLQDLGLLLDVEDMLERVIGPRKYRPMPSLERLSFNYPILLRPEEELKRGHLGLSTVVSPEPLPSPSQCLLAKQLEQPTARSCLKKKLAGAARFHCCIYVETFTIHDLVFRDNPLRQLLTQFQDEYKRTRDEIVAINVCIPPISTFTSLILTRRPFSIRTVVQGSLNSILQNCPALESVKVNGLFELALTWTPLIIGELQHFALRNLLLDSVIFKPDSLEDLMLFTRLKVLELAAIPWRDYGLYDWSIILELIRSLPISLDLIHILTQGQRLTPQGLQKILNILPVVSK
ncbi:hypothetical protein BG015_002950, partial [Linnemannia schmuckeri]